MKLNLGCGQNRLDGYVNADREPVVEPDVVMDLEEFPWPFDEHSVDEVMANHVLEHVGARAEVFIENSDRVIGVMARTCVGSSMKLSCRGWGTAMWMRAPPRHTR